MSYEVLARKIVDWMHKDIDNRTYYDAMCYGLEILISTIGNIFLTISIALMLHIGLETIIYCLFFIPYRVMSGGAHAKTHTKCFLTFTVCQLLAIAFSKISLLNSLFPVLNIGFALISLIICIRYATSTKQLSSRDRRRYRVVSILIVTLDSVIIATATYTWVNSRSYMFIASTAILIQSIALLPIYNREGESKDEKQYETKISC